MSSAETASSEPASSQSEASASPAHDVPESPVGPEPHDEVAAGYASALGELEEILVQLERSDVDVDTLATHVQRASELIGFCRQRIARARLRIDQVVAGLDD